jgi:rfaE bifunctional protein nucleotidyltransferase chain/domain
MRSESKIWNRENFRKQLAPWKEKGDVLVFTNGCFDILHTGHLNYLERARSLGDRLIIGLNSDDSVRRLKGKPRPINALEDRARMLASLMFVDAIIPFHEDTPYDLISDVLPDILVKGGDYVAENIVGADIVTSRGGRVEVLQFVDGFSTTSIIEKIKNLNE